DNNSDYDVFALDLSMGAMTLVSHTSGSPTTTGNNASGYSRINNNGTVISFTSDATDLVVGQTGGITNLFVYDRGLGGLTLLSHVGGSPSLAVSDTTYSSVSGDGNAISFTSPATNLVPGQTDGNGASDVYVFDRRSGGTNLVSHVPGSASST